MGIRLAPTLSEDKGKDTTLGCSTEAHNAQDSSAKRDTQDALPVQVCSSTDEMVPNSMDSVLCVVLLDKTEYFTCTVERALRRGE